MEIYVIREALPIISCVVAALLLPKYLSVVLQFIFDNPVYFILACKKILSELYFYFLAINCFLSN